MYKKFRRKQGERFCRRGTLLWHLSILGTYDWTAQRARVQPRTLKQLLYRLDVSIQHPTELASLGCTLRYPWDAYWVPNMRIAWQSTMHTEVRKQGTDQTSHYYSLVGSRKWKQKLPPDSENNETVGSWIHFRIPWSDQRYSWECCTQGSRLAHFCPSIRYRVVYCV